MEGKIEHGKYVQGDFSFAVDANDAHKTFDAVQALSQADKVKLAELNNIPTGKPVAVRSLTTVLKALVQKAWFAQKQGSVPVDVITIYDNCLSAHNAQIAAPAVGFNFLSRRTRTHEKARKSLMYSFDEKKYEADWDKTEGGKNWRGQRYLVVKSFIDLTAKPREAGTGPTVRELFENCKETRETPAPSRNGVLQIVNAMVTAGLATCLNPQDAKKKPEKKAPAAEQPAKKTPPASPAKKKH